MQFSDPCFKNLLGHDRAKSLLREAVSNNKVGHAYLFRGPDGVGKKRAAVTFGAFLNCENRGDDACGRCASCRKYIGGSHPDFIHIAPDGAAIKIGQVRELKHQLAFPPLEATTRVILLEDIHTMRREAANSLLKTLEEPAPNNLLILTADQSGTILPTIISRCQVIPFGPLDHEEMAMVLMREHDLEESRALALASVAEGSLGRAKLLMEEKLLAFRQEVVEELLLKQNNQAEITSRVYRFSERGAALKENIYEFLALLRLWYRDLVLAAAGVPESSVANKDLASCLPAALKRWDPVQLHRRLHLLDRAERQLSHNCSRSLVLEALFFDLL
jgi:DNA polymerase-3 subunit delta'